MKEEILNEDLDNKKTLLSLFSASLLLYFDLIDKNSYLLTGNRNAKVIKDVPIFFDAKDEVISCSLVSAGALLLAMYKDSLLYDTGSGLSLSIDEQKFRTFVNRVIRITKKKAYIGDIEFNNYLEAFNFIRNKILHGEYNINKKSIVFNKDGKEGTISAESFAAMVLCIEEEMEIGNNSLTRSIIVSKKDKNKSLYQRIKEDKLDLIEIEVLKKGKRKVNPSDMLFVDDYIKNIQWYAAHYNCDIYEADDVFKSKNPKFYNHVVGNIINRNISLKYTKKNIKEEPRYEQAKALFLNESNTYLDVIKDNSVNFDDYFLQIMCDRLEDEREVGKNITIKGFKNYIRVLKHNLKNQDVTAENILDKRYFSYKEDLIIISLFISFYGKYHYGLDNIYSNGSYTNLKEILSSNKFDFNEIDLSLFDDPSMDLEISLNNYLEQSISINNEYLNFISSFDSIKKQYMNTKDNDRVPDNIKDTIKNNYFLAKDKIEKDKQMIDKLNAFDLNVFERRLNLIYHIRNAFAHGGVILLPYSGGDILDDRKVLIEDVYQGKVTYKKETTFKDYESLFSFDNNKKMGYFVVDKMDEKSRSLAKEGEISFSDDELILPEKKNEWDNLYESYKNEENSIELLNMEFALFGMSFISINLNNINNRKEMTEDLYTFLSSIETDDIEISFDKIFNYINLYYNNVPKEYSDNWLKYSIISKKRNR